MPVCEVPSDYQLGVARRQPVRTLREATFDPALYNALEAFVGCALSDAAVLIGALATNFYAKPRFADHAEFLVKALPVDLPDAFACQEGGSFIHVPSSARMQFMTPSMLNLPTDLATKIFTTATLRDGLLVASREAIVALNLAKAEDRRTHHECLAIVVSVLAYGDVDLTNGFLLDYRAAAHPLRCQLNSGNLIA